MKNAKLIIILMNQEIINSLIAQWISQMMK